MHSLSPADGNVAWPHSTTSYYMTVHKEQPTAVCF